MQEDPIPPTSSDDLIKAARDSVGSNESRSEQMLEEARNRIETDLERFSTEADLPMPTDSEPVAVPVPDSSPRMSSPSPPPAPPPATRQRRAPKANRRPAPPMAPPGRDPLTGGPRRSLPKVARALIPLVILGVIFFSNFIRDNADAPDAVPVVVTVATQAPETAVEAQVPGPSTNLALYRPVEVTGMTADAPGANAVDGDPTTAWNSGGYPPQVIEIDLGEPATVREVRLRVGQAPAVGETVHAVFVSGPGTDNQQVQYQVHEDVTRDGTWITLEGTTPMSGIDHVAVLTAKSPSWVAWFEIEVLGIAE